MVFVLNLRSNSAKNIDPILSASIRKQDTAEWF